MNETDPAINLDELRMMPSWLREDAPAPAQKYAAHDFPTDDSRDRRGGRDGGGFGGRSGGGFGGRGPREGGGQGRSGGGEQRARPSSGGSGSRDRSRSGPPPRGGRDDRRQAPPPPAAPVAPAPVRVEFLPDDRCLTSITKQVRSRHMAYPLFGLARMFLQEPARHAVQFTLDPAAAEAGAQLYQLGDDGPVTLDKHVLEKIGFDQFRERHYVEQTVQKDPPKGNFTSVARDRLSGVVLGPTNYHAYQPALRALYESRYSRRMSFEDFRRNVEVVSDPALVEKWKEEVRSVVTISTLEGEPPTILNSPAEARAHFRQHYFEGLLRTGTSFRLPGAVARNLPEPTMMAAIRQAHEPEIRYPARFVQLLRQGLQEAGLHIFKHRKRFVYVAASRPTPFAGEGAVSESVAAILDLIGKSPLITRKALGERLLTGKVASAPAPAVTPVPAPAAAEESVAAVSTAPLADEVAVTPAPAERAELPSSEALPTGEADAIPTAEVKPPASAVAEDPQSKAKAALASDLRFLVQAGHIIEFHNGTFDLPVPPRPKIEQKPRAPKTSTSPAAEAAAKPEADSGEILPIPTSGEIEAAEHSAEVSKTEPEAEIQNSAEFDPEAVASAEPPPVERIEGEAEPTTPPADEIVEPY